MLVALGLAVLSAASLALESRVQLVAVVVAWLGALATMARARQVDGRELRLTPRLLLTALALGALSSLPMVVFDLGPAWLGVQAALLLLLGELSTTKA